MSAENDAARVRPDLVRARSQLADALRALDGARTDLQLTGAYAAQRDIATAIAAVDYARHTLDLAIREAT